MSRKLLILCMLCLLATGCGLGTDDGTEGISNDKFALDPDRYRNEIETVEQILYGESPHSISNYDRISGAIFQLGSRALEAEDHPLRKEKARLIMSLASHSSMVSETGYGLRDMGFLRSGWEDVRQQVFQPVDWFETTKKGSATSPSPHSPPVSMGEVKSFQLVLDRVEILIEKGRWEVEELGEPIYELEQIGPEGLEQIQRWQRWSREWSERLEASLTGLSVTSPGADESDLFYAHQSLERAVQNLRTVPMGSDSWPTPHRYLWEQRFATAERAIAEARAHLEKSY